MQVTAMPEVGQEAPEFRLKGPAGQYVALSEFRGYRNVLLVFYPLAFSPVCSHQLPAIQKELARFRALSTEVIGISVDSHYANEVFARQLGLEFPLLSDFHRRTAAEYGVLLSKYGYANRALFLVDKQGKVAFKDVSPSLDEIPSNERVLQVLEGMA